MTEPSADGSSPVATPAEVVAIPASFAQESLWFLDRLSPGGAAYNIPLAFLAVGPLRVPALEAAFNDLVARHESLRTTFSELNGRPVQVIAPSLHVHISTLDMSGMTDPEGEARARVVADAARACPLGTGPLCRAAVYRLASERAIVAFVFHHIVVDGWSVGVLLDELAEAYAARVAGLTPAWPPVSLQYADYAMWLRGEVDAGAFDASLTYFRDRLLGLDAPIALPFDRRRPARSTYTGGKVFVRIERTALQPLDALMKREGTTLFMTLLATWAVLLARQASEDRIVVGTPAANRLQAEVERSVGFYANVLALVCDTSGSPTFREVLARVKTVALEAFERQDTPFERVVELVQPSRELNANPLFQVMFALQRVPDAAPALAGVTLSPIDIDNGTAKFDLLIELQEQSSGVGGYVEFNGDVFERATVERLVTRFRRLLAQVATAPDARIADYELLDDAERRQVVDTWNATASAGAPASVLELYAATLARVPDAPAVHMGAVTWSYRELDARAARLAARLRHASVGTDTCVGVACPRSPDLIAAIVGVLQSGAAYVPLDASYPLDRLQYMLRQAGVRTVVTTAAFGATLAAGTSDLEILTLESSPDVLREGRVETASPGADDLAYVLFTSGSTGRPKGVAMRHGPVANLMAWQRDRSLLPPGARTLQFSPISFDVSFQEIFATLGTGGTLVLIDEETRRDPRLLLRYLSSERIDRIFLPFVALHHLAEAAAAVPVPLQLGEVVTAGEQLQATPALRQFFTRLGKCRLDNQYGPTETHVITAHALDGPPSTWPDLPPIGRPVANARVYVVDAHLRPVPVGVAGELLLGGDALARGYIGDAEQTAERFLANPFVPGERVYRSGDRGRFTASGDIEFLGRVDDQVKIRGYRVEPLEVEAILAGHPRVGACAVVAHATSTGPGLAAYVVRDSGAALDLDEVRRFLHDRLPDYMVPGAFMALDSLPLTASGKVNRRALPAIVPERSTTSPVAEPRDDTERALAAVWAKVLGQPSIGMTDDFFALGGHSLLAARLVAEIERTLHVTVPVALLFKTPTIERMAAHLKGPAPIVVPDRVVPLNECKNGAQPLFLVHAIAGGVFAYRQFADRLQRPVFGVQGRFEQGIPAYLDDLRELARHYLQDIRSVQPTGPYLLGGWSAGGTIALEMAQQLLAAGESVSLLVEIDSAPYNVPDDARRRQASYWLKLAANVPPWIVDEIRTGEATSLPSRVWRRLGSYVRKSRLRLSGGVTYAAEVGGFMNTGPLGSSRKAFVERLYTSLRNYRPQPYAGRVLLFQARVHPLTKLHESDRAWRRLCPHVQIVPLPGNHLSVVVPPQVDQMARALDAALAQSSKP
ncbi:MAG: amino acid adenylation domain-containing protein [Vicinamibacterales bacterium]